MTIIDKIVPICIIVVFAIILYMKVSYIRQFFHWAWGKLTEEKEAVIEKVDKSKYQLAFKYGS
jgi:hypothetical protein